MDYLYGWYSWAKQAVCRMGLWKIKANVILVGLDNAGKTTLLHVLKTNTLKQSPPSKNPTMEEVSVGLITFKAYDMGGNVRERFLWVDYFPLVDAIVFMVDTADRSRLLEAKEVLDGILSLEQVAKTPILIMGNKIDVQGAVSEDELSKTLGCTSDHIHIEMTSIIRHFGIKEGFSWLENELIKRLV
uniref:Uncharacterized protein n=1 Tax=Arcella intermedia TaxID=1963864 RepID=A0A6B2LKB2_9EUKA|eukprot:TRINITY_DN27153_c0_g1_i1.p1 TRINITY_DN27153_c0_g1~~TRINITY_DN27153_c0_g1_i1.p1  ORF type:complete len:187 (+),score=21.62 TRINITY_DN27153_c0_g1_i1:202-762(+)